MLSQAVRLRPRVSRQTSQSAPATRTFSTTSSRIPHKNAILRDLTSLVQSKAPDFKLALADPPAPAANKRPTSYFADYLAGDNLAWEDFTLCNRSCQVATRASVQGDPASVESSIQRLLDSVVITLEKSKTLQANPARRDAVVVAFLRRIARHRSLGPRFNSILAYPPLAKFITNKLRERAVILAAHHIHVAYALKLFESAFNSPNFKPTVHVFNALFAALFRRFRQLVVQCYSIDAATSPGDTGAEAEEKAAEPRKEQQTHIRSLYRSLQVDYSHTNEVRRNIFSVRAYLDGELAPASATGHDRPRRSAELTRKLAAIQQIEKRVSILYASMESMHIEPNTATFEFILPVVTAPRKKRSLIDRVIQLKLPLTSRALVELYNETLGTTRLAEVDSLRQNLLARGHASALTTPLLNAILSAYLQNHKVAEAFALIQRHMPFIQREIFKWNRHFRFKPIKTSIHHLVEECSRLISDPVVTMNAWNLLVGTKGIEPTGTTFVAVFRQVPSPSRLRTLWISHVPTHLRMCGPLLATAMHRSAELGDVEFARILMTELSGWMPRLSVLDIEIVVEAMCWLKIPYIDLNVSLGSLVQRNNVHITERMFVSLLDSIRSLKEIKYALQVFDHMARWGCRPTTLTLNALLRLIQRVVMPGASHAVAAAPRPSVAQEEHLRTPSVQNLLFSYGQELAERFKSSTAAEPTSVLGQMSQQLFGAALPQPTPGPSQRRGVPLSSSQNQELRKHLQWLMNASRTSGKV